MKISKGFADRERAEIAALYWGAFGAKLGRVMAPERKALAFITEVLDPEFALVARDEDGALLGLAGFKTYDGAFVGGGLSEMRHHYGAVGALWRGLLLGLLERDIENERFLMDGIFVTPRARGKGVGTALLSAIYDEGQRRGYREVRLDVIDSNPRARALYEREGFRGAGEIRLGPLRHLFGFSTATTMVRPV